MGASDPEARVGIRKKNEYFLGYRVHLSCDWNSELPTTYVVRPANENEKRHFKSLASQAKKRFRNAKWHVADSQYSSRELRSFVREDLKGRSVIAKMRSEKGGGRLLHGQEVPVPWKQEDVQDVSEEDRL